MTNHTSGSFMKLCLLIFFFSGFGSAISQEKFAVSGTISDALNGETHTGASVYLEGTTIGTTTNEYGFYSITAPPGTYILKVSFLGFNEISQNISLDKNLKLSFELIEQSTKLDEVIITGGDIEGVNIKSPQMSVSSLKASSIQQIPAVLGEADVISAIQLLPGITNSGEGTGGFNVRGGASDQNLVLLDEAIIYNTSHLFGFFSVFNTDAIKDIKLYKGGIPPQFGGRVSSVLDIRQKDGNSKKFGMNGGIGALSGRLTAEGPMFGEKGSFLIAGRSSYAHLFLKLTDNDNSAYFYDLNAKGSYRLNENNRLFLSGYYGRDLFDLGETIKNSYGNISGNLRWNHIFSDRLFSNLSLIYSKYNYEILLNFIELDWVADIENYNVKYDLKYFIDQNFSLDYGISGILYDFNPGIISPASASSPINYLRLDQKRAFEGSLYLSTETVWDRLSATYGLRYSYFNRLGGQHMNIYENDMPLVYNAAQGVYEEGQVEGEQAYSKNESIRSFGNLEPRISVSYQLTDNSSLKLSYTRAAQYIHLISNTTTSTPLDVWAPSGKFIEPQISDQYAAGYFQNFKDEILTLEVEAYFKTVDNRLDYIDGSSLIGNNNIETEILSGESRAYGLEFLLRKNSGKLTGWLAYTLSRSEQRTPGGMAGGPGINDGKWYKTPYDRTHDISVTSNYTFNHKWKISSNFIFQTGRPVTYPNGQYEYEGISIASYSLRNKNRLPSYNRLDISATYTPVARKKRLWQGEWNFSIYNLYNRKNAASISFGQNRETGMNEATRTAIFGIIPSVSYNFKF